MKNILKIVGIGSLSLVILNAHADVAPLTITGAFSKVFTTDRDSNRKLDIYGSGFFPGNDLATAMKDSQISYRQISPNLSDWKTASNSTGSDAWIVTLGPNEVDMFLGDAIVQANTAWSFMVCNRTVGCSNALNIQVQGPGAQDVQINNTVGTSDLAVGNGGSDGSPFYLPVSGLSTYAPFLRIGNFNYYGEYVPTTHEARFMIPSSVMSKPGFYTAFVEDSITGTDSNSFSLRVFGTPNVISGAPAITEALGAFGSPTDATMKLKFADMTFPYSFQFVDGANVHSFTVPMDLLTETANITIPAAWLRVATYTASLVMQSTGGTTTLPVAVTITKPTVIPIPNPHPFPTPIHPFPTPIHP